MTLEDLKKVRKHIDEIEQPFWNSIAGNIKEIQGMFLSMGITNAKDIGTIMGIVIRSSDNV